MVDATVGMTAAVVVGGIEGLSGCAGPSLTTVKSNPEYLPTTAQGGGATRGTPGSSWGSVSPASVSKTSSNTRYWCTASLRGYGCLLPLSSPRWWPWPASATTFFRFSDFRPKPPLPEASVDADDATVAVVVVVVSIMAGLLSGVDVTLGLCTLALLAALFAALVEVVGDGVVVAGDDDVDDDMATALAAGWESR